MPDRPREVVDVVESRVAASSGWSATATMAQHMRESMGAFGPDQAVRQAITTCWRMLREDRRTPDEVEQHVRRLLERALSEFREDSATFGFA